MASRSIDQLSRDVASAFAERDLCTPELERLSQGALTPERLSALRLDAAHDPELSAALDALEPITDSLKDQISARLLLELAASRGDAGESPSPAVAAPPAPRPTSRRRLWVLAPLLAAAALPFLFRSGVEPLPSYDVEVVQTRSETRNGDVPPSTVLHPSAGQQVEVLLRPAVAVIGSVEVMAFLIADAAPPTFPAEAHEISSTGAVRMKLSWPPAPERGRLVLLVARPGRLSPELGREPRAAGDGWQRFELPFELAAPR